MKDFNITEILTVVSLSFYVTFVSLNIAAKTIVNHLLKIWSLQVPLIPLNITKTTTKRKKSERSFSIWKLTKHPPRRFWMEWLGSVPDTASSWSPGGRSGLSSSGTTRPYPSSWRTGSGIQTWTAGSDWSSVGYTVIQDKIHTELMKKSHHIYWYIHLL